MSNSTNKAIETIGFGFLIYYLLIVIIGFAPSLILSLSLADTFSEWHVAETSTVDMNKWYNADDNDNSWYGSIQKETHETMYGDKWREELAKTISSHEDTPGSGLWTTTTYYNGNAFFFLIGFFIFFSSIQAAMWQNIRECWGILLVWWLLTIYPWLCWFEWFMTDDHGYFPGIDWMPW